MNDLTGLLLVLLSQVIQTTLIWWKGKKMVNGQVEDALEGVIRRQDERIQKRIQRLPETGMVEPGTYQGDQPVNKPGRRYRG